MSDEQKYYTEINEFHNYILQKYSKFNINHTSQKLILQILSMHIPEEFHIFKNIECMNLDSYDKKSQIRIKKTLLHLLNIIPILITCNEYYIIIAIDVSELIPKLCIVEFNEGKSYRTTNISIKEYTSIKNLWKKYANNYEIEYKNIQFKKINMTQKNIDEYYENIDEYYSDIFDDIIFMYRYERSIITVH
jgi:hypothetical protein